MHDEDGFLNKLLENPTDDTVRLVYADWLDERGGEEDRTKAQFLRLTVKLLDPGRPGHRHEDLCDEMQPLAAKLPTDWLAVVSRLKVDYCGKMATMDDRAERFRRQFEFVCDRGWDEMAATGDASVRFCSRCEENVHYCDTITAARQHAERGHCIAVDLGVIRHDNDLAPRRWVKGKPSADFWRKEEERLAVDAVSREREERKRQNAGGRD